MQRTLALTALLLSIGLAGSALASPCGEETGSKKVLVRAKTTFRRGPGLNYPVAQFLDEGRCLKLGEISIDGAWVLVQDKAAKVFGWVQISQVDPESQAALSAIQPKSGPVGSGQARSVAVTNKNTKLRKTPSMRAEAKKPLAAGSKLLLLAISEDGAWLEVRDDRLDTGWVRKKRVDADAKSLAELPKSDAGLVTGLAGSKSKTSSVGVLSGVDKDRTKEDEEEDEHDDDAIGIELPPDLDRPEPESPDVALEAQVLGVAAVPIQGLDSNGNAGTRRYTISAFAAGAQLSATITHLGPLRLRAAYGFVFMGGLSQKDQPGASIGGSEHDARILFGFPIRLRSARLVPEIGYGFGLSSLRPSFPGGSAPLFFSSHTHGVDFGATLQFPIGAGFALDASLAGLLGSTLEYPFDLGRGGLTAQARVGLGGKLALSDALSLVLRWDARFRNAPFGGPSGLDPSITDAKLTLFENAFSAGVALKL